jgi:hypothetical protein
LSIFWCSTDDASPAYCDGVGGRGGGGAPAGALRVTPLTPPSAAFAGRGFETVAVAMAYDRPDFVLYFARTHALPFPVALDLQGTVAQAFGPVAVTPTTVLIGPGGDVIRRWVGEPESWPALEALIESHLIPS